MKRLISEPLFQFLMLGLGLFIINHLWETHIARSDYTIQVSAAEIERQAAIFATENRRQPTDEDIKALLFAHVEEQVLMREAERLGLAEDDTIIRRRLAQKMRFMIEDSVPPALPSDTELRAWFDIHIDRFVVPERRSFTHVFLSPEARGDNLDTDAKSVLNSITDENWNSLGDPFILQKQYQNQSPADVRREFGGPFTKALFASEGDGWSEPISSAYGLHIIRIDARSEQSRPSFEEVRNDVVSAWQEQARREANRDKLTALLEKYKVDVEDLGE